MFNEDDKQYLADRRSCLGRYKLQDGLPLNPFGRTGITGRGLLNYWGPNHVIEAVFTRFDLYLGFVYFRVVKNVFF
jgi:transient receptor potential cation channel subfamily M protein 2